MPRMRRNPAPDGEPMASAGQQPQQPQVQQQQQPQQQEKAPAELILEEFWPTRTEEIRNLNAENIKRFELPLARIKKIMRIDGEVKMISGEAPALFSKACELFIMEFTLRSWIHTEENKRRTLQKNDMIEACDRNDTYDFLIDIVPRDETRSRRNRAMAAANSSMAASQPGSAAPASAATVQAPTVAVATPAVAQTAVAATTAAAVPQSVQQQATVATPGTAVPQAAAVAAGVSQSTAVEGVGGEPVVYYQQGQAQPAASMTAQPQVIQLQPNGNMMSAVAPRGGIQIITQIMGPNGELQQVPMTLDSNQVEMIRTQMTGGNQSQPIVIQTAPIQTAPQGVVTGSVQQLQTLQSVASSQQLQPLQPVPASQELHPMHQMQAVQSLHTLQPMPPMSSLPAATGQLTSTGATDQQLPVAQQLSSGDGTAQHMSSMDQQGQLHEAIGNDQQQGEQRDEPTF